MHPFHGWHSISSCIGRQFNLITDHKPLVHLFGESQGIPTMASARLQRWALTMSGYDYKIVYKSGKEICNADGLSRLPLPDSPLAVPLPGETVCLLECLQQSPVTWNQVKNWTARDPLLSKVYQYTMQGWPGTVTDELQPYSRKKDEISTEGGCLLWGCRVIIPPQGRTAIVDLLYQTHPGIQRMKTIARSYVWWPGMEDQLENKFAVVQAVKSTKGTLRKHHYIPGIGLTMYGQGYMWILLVHSWANNSSFS